MSSFSGVSALLTVSLLAIVTMQILKDNINSVEFYTPIDGHESVNSYPFDPVGPCPWDPSIICASGGAPPPGGTPPPQPQKNKQDPHDYLLPSKEDQENNHIFIHPSLLAGKITRSGNLSRLTDIRGPPHVQHKPGELCGYYISPHAQ